MPQATPLAAARRIDLKCREFEGRLRAGGEPRLEQFVDDADADVIDDLFHELLTVELDYRLEIGERPAVEEYGARFPDRAAAISEAFAAVASDPPPLPITKRDIGGYRIDGVIGRGGMGVVYRAVQPSLNRTVALKMLPPFASLHPTMSRRFAREGEAIARLQHPHIVQVYDAADDDSCHYIAMEFVDGGTLERLIRQAAKPSHVDVECDTDRGELTLGGTPSTIDLVSDPDAPGRSEAIAEIGIQLAEALQFAHDHGVIHRDVKPSNVLLNKNGDAKLADFGLAQLLSDASMTATGEFIGTLRYAAPECFEGDSDQRADVYGLGLTIYESLALRPAFESTTRPQLLKQILTRGPAKLPADVPMPLRSIIARAIHPDREHRYQTAGELAADLRRYRAGERVSAGGRRTRRRAWIAAMAGATLLVAAGLSYLLPSPMAAEAPRSTTGIGSGQAASPIGTDAVAEELRVEPIATATLEGIVHHLAFSHSGERLAVATNRAVVSLDPTTGEQQWKLQRGYAPRRVEWSPNDDLLAVCQYNAFERSRGAGPFILNFIDPTGRWSEMPGYAMLEQSVLEGETEVAYPVFHPSDSLLFIALGGGLRISNPIQRAAGIQLERTTKNGVNLARFSPDGELLAVGKNNCRIQLWATDGLPLGEFRCLGGTPPYRVRFQPFGSHLAVVGGAGLQVWDIGGERVVFDHRVPGTRWRLAYSPDGRRLAVARNEGCDIYDTVSWKPVAHLPVDSNLHDIFFSPDGEQLTLVSNSAARSFSLDDQLLRTDLAFDDTITTAAVSRDGLWIALGGQRGTLCIYPR